MTKKILSVLTFLSFSLLHANAGTPLTDGTYVQILLTQDISSKDTLTPPAVIASDIVIDGKILISKGTPVQAQFTRQKPRCCGRAGSFTLEFLSTTSVDGQLILLRGRELTVKGMKRMGLSLGLGVGTGWLFLPGLACLAIRGKHAQLPAGTIATGVMVANNYNIEAN